MQINNFKKRTNKPQNTKTLMLLQNAENLELHHEQEALKTREMGL